MASLLSIRAALDALEDEPRTTKQRYVDMVESCRKLAHNIESFKEIPQLRAQVKIDTQDTKKCR